MIEGMLTLDFDIFRRCPFESAILEFSNDFMMTVKKTDDEDFPLYVKANHIGSRLCKDKSDPKYTSHDDKLLNEFRSYSAQAVNKINFELLDIHRSLPLKMSGAKLGAPSIDHRWSLPHHLDQYGRVIRSSAKEPDDLALSQRVKVFLRDAQVNYRQFFSAEELELLPRIIERFQNPTAPASKEQIARRVDAERLKIDRFRRFGLQTDESDLESLLAILSNDQYVSNPYSLTLLEAYVETQESKSQARELITKRIFEFEKIMDDFLIGKTVRVDAKSGLSISTNEGLISETDLSSGEFHFLYMMVSALLCQRTGTIIAIDEPELSLHVTWQRKLIKALTNCASGASPLFMFATHSMAIQAEHKDKVIVISNIES